MYIHSMYILAMYICLIQVFLNIIYYKDKNINIKEYDSH